MQFLCFCAEEKAADTSRMRILCIDKFCDENFWPFCQNFCPGGNKYFPSIFDTNVKTTFYVMINKYLLCQPFGNMQILVINRPNRKPGLLSPLHTLSKCDQCEKHFNLKRFTLENLKKKVKIGVSGYSSTLLKDVLSRRTRNPIFHRNGNLFNHSSDLIQIPI